MRFTVLLCATALFVCLAGSATAGTLINTDTKRYTFMLRYPKFVEKEDWNPMRHAHAQYESGMAAITSKTERRNMCPHGCLIEFEDGQMFQMRPGDIVEIRDGKMRKIGWEQP